MLQKATENFATSPNNINNIQSNDNGLAPAGEEGWRDESGMGERARESES